VHSQAVRAVYTLLHGHQLRSKHRLLLLRVAARCRDTVLSISPGLELLQMRRIRRRRWATQVCAFTLGSFHVVTHTQKPYPCRHVFVLAPYSKLSGLSLIFSNVSGNGNGMYGHGTSWFTASCMTILCIFGEHNDYQEPSRCFLLSFVMMMTAIKMCLNTSLMKHKRGCRTARKHRCKQFKTIGCSKNTKNHGQIIIGCFDTRPNKVKKLYGVKTTVTQR